MFIFFWSIYMHFYIGNGFRYGMQYVQNNIAHVTDDLSIDHISCVHSLDEHLSTLLPLIHRWDEHHTLLPLIHRWDEHHTLLPLIHRWDEHHTLLPLIHRWDEHHTLLPLIHRWDEHHTLPRLACVNSWINTLYIKPCVIFKNVSFG